MPATIRTGPLPPEITTLRSGDRMTADEFHRVYSMMPERFKAELVGGTVYVASPLSIDHGLGHTDINGLLWTYAGHTPGVECGNNTTVRLGPKAEPQPDLYLRILPEFGGQSASTADHYVDGAPELVVEVSYSSWSLDLQAKHDDYQRHGVLEYLVLDLHAERLHWFDLPNNRELSPDSDGVIRVHAFPGLWLNVAAILARDYSRMMATLNAGLASPEHAAFVLALAARRKQ